MVNRGSDFFKFKEKKTKTGVGKCVKSCTKGQKIPNFVMLLSEYA